VYEKGGKKEFLCSPCQENQMECRERGNPRGRGKRKSVLRAVGRGGKFGFLDLRKGARRPLSRGNWEGGGNTKGDLLGMPRGRQKKSGRANIGFFLGKMMIIAQNKGTGRGKEGLTKRP